MLKKYPVLLFIAVFAVIAASCSESDDDAEAGSTSTTVEPTGTDEPGSGDDGDPDSVVGEFAGEEWIFGTVPDAPTAADESLEPVKLGLINQENSLAGSFPEIRGAIQAGIAFANAELGGVGGRPIELTTCDVNVDAGISQACAQDMVQADVVALVGGIDIGSSGSIPVLNANGIPQVGGIPATPDEQRSDLMFYQSGGTAGAVAAMMKHAKDNGATKVFLTYVDFEAFSASAELYGVPAGEDLGLEVITSAFPLQGADFLPVLTKAAETGAEAVIVLAADTACVQVMRLFPEIVPDAQLYMTGACAAEEIADELGDLMDVVILNNEGPNEPTVEGEIYQAVVDRYAVDPAGGAGTVGFRGFMNLYSLLDELGPDGITSEAIAELAEASFERPNYWGYPYSCSIEQVPGLPALCAPQQTLFRFVEGEVVDAGGGWIDTVPLLENAGPQG